MMENVRELFDILNTSVYGKPLIYFDNAATTQKPRSVVETLTGYYTTLNSNIHRSYGKIKYLLKTYMIYQRSSQ